MDWHVLLITCVMIVLDIVLGFASAVKCGDVESGILCALLVRNEYIARVSARSNSLNDACIYQALE